MEKAILRMTIECVKGDVASQADVFAIVKAANAELIISSGVAGALYKAGGSMSREGM